MFIVDIKYSPRDISSPYLLSLYLLTHFTFQVFFNKVHCWSQIYALSQSQSIFWVSVPFAYNSFTLNKRQVCCLAWYCKMLISNHDYRILIWWPCAVLFENILNNVLLKDLFRQLDKHRRVIISSWLPAGVWCHKWCSQKFC